MDLNFCEAELQAWLERDSMKDMVRYMLHFNTDFTLTIFRNGGGSYSFYLSNGQYGDLIKTTPEFQHACEKQNLGIIKETILMFTKYLRQKGFGGELKIGQLL